MNRLQGKNAVVTGGNSGIGRATAEAFAREGAKVAIFGRDPKTLADATAALGDQGLGVQGDVTSLSDLDRLAAEVKQKLGKVDAVFINAGVGKTSTLAEATPEHFDQLFDINVKGAFFTIQKLLPLLNDGASIVLNASVAGQLGMPGFSVYSATKAALRSFARSLSAELVDRGIRVNVVSPGPIETPIFGRMGLSEQEQQGMAEGILNMVPMKRMGQASEVANAVTFLASPESSYIAGTELEVDGGMSQL